MHACVCACYEGGNRCITDSESVRIHLHYRFIHYRFIICTHKSNETTFHRFSLFVLFICVMHMYVCIYIYMYAHAICVLTVCIHVHVYTYTHIQVTGGGGESGPESKVPEAQLSHLVRAGLTTLVGVLGTDSLSRSPAELLTKVNALNRGPINAYMYTGIVCVHVCVYVCIRECVCVYV